GPPPGLRGPGDPPAARLRSHLRQRQGQRRPTGLAAAGHEAVVLADDDVRYDQEGLRRLVGLLKAADLVRPQTSLAPAPGRPRPDTARPLLNRVAGGDFPGTLGAALADPRRRRLRRRRAVR